MENERNLPRPTEADYQKRKALEKRNESGWDDDYLDIMNAYDWSTEVFDSGKNWGLKNALGKVILEPLYEDFMMLSWSELEIGDRVVAQKNSKWGVLIIDGPGTWVVEPEYDYISYPNNLTALRKNNKWGVFDFSRNEFLIPLDCDSISVVTGLLFTNGVGFYQKGGKTGIITDDGRFTAPIFEEIDCAPEELVKVKFNGNWGYLDENMNFTLVEDEACIAMDVD
jgi:hypothetical protein